MTIFASMDTPNRKVISRLSRYKNALYRFKGLGFVKIFSDYLADAVDLTPSQIRKDFSLFGLTGNKRGGYMIDELLDKLQNILGKNEAQHVVIVGAGNLGTALSQYRGFSKEGIDVVACFDIDPAKVQRQKLIPILPMSELAEFVKSHSIRIGIICVPDTMAQDVADRMIAAGIRGILNFAPIQLRTQEKCVVSYVNVEQELESIIYFVNACEKEGNSDLGFSELA